MILATLALQPTSIGMMVASPELAHRRVTATQVARESLSDLRAGEPSVPGRLVQSLGRAIKACSALMRTIRQGVPHLGGGHLPLAQPPSLPEQSLSEVTETQKVPGRLEAEIREPRAKLDAEVQE